jgi:hypothetical protein
MADVLRCRKQRQRPKENEGRLLPDATAAPEIGLFRT